MFINEQDYFHTRSQIVDQNNINEINFILCHKLWIKMMMIDKINIILSVKTNFCTQFIQLFKVLKYRYLNMFEFNEMLHLMK